MPFRYARKTERTHTTQDQILGDVRDVVENMISVRKAGQQHGVSRSSLDRWVKQYKQNPESMLGARYDHPRVFSNEQESVIAEYIVRCSKMFLSLTPMMVKKLAYDVVEANGFKIPEEWERTKMAGKDWFRGFMHRNPTLALRQPEQTSLARATSFQPSQRYTVLRQSGKHSS